MKIPVLIDEMNMMHQLHRVNVKNMNWLTFCKVLRKVTNVFVEGHFFCANVPECFVDVHQKRKNYFNRLREQGITVHEGFSVTDSKQRRFEKGVDVLIAIKAYQFALEGVRDILLCTADTDLVPAIQAVQALGCRVHVIVSDYAEARELSQAADSVISLESVLELVNKKKGLRWKDETSPMIYSIYENTKKYRKGVVC